MHTKSLNAVQPTNPQRGFTLVEMIVVLAIMVAITTIALLGQSSFNKSLILTDTAYTIAFSVREAQSFGISSRAFGSTQNAGYGVSFTAGALTSYKLFADISPTVVSGNIQPVLECPGHTISSGPEARPGDCIWNNETETVRTYSLNNGFRIKNFCGTPVSGGAARCSDSGTTIDALDITYLRPNTQSVINGIRSGTRIPLSNAIIRVTSPDGSTERCIYVAKTGQVSVHAKGETECP